MFIARSKTLIQLPRWKPRPGQAVPTTKEKLSHAEWVEFERMREELGGTKWDMEVHPPSLSASSFLDPGGVDADGIGFRKTHLPTAVETTPQSTPSESPTSTVPPTPKTPPIDINNLYQEWKKWRGASPPSRLLVPEERINLRHVG